MNTRNGSRIDTLIAQSARGDTRAFGDLVMETQTYVYALAFRMLGDSDDALDAVQESFVRVWKHLGVYDGRALFTTWLYTIISRVCLDHLRVRTRADAHSVRIGGDAASDPAVESPAGEIEARDLADAVLAIARELPPVQQLVFMLRDLEDLTVREVRDITGLSEGSVKTNLCYARKTIRARMEELESIRR